MEADPYRSLGTASSCRWPGSAFFVVPPLGSNVIERCRLNGRRDYLLKLLVTDIVRSDQLHCTLLAQPIVKNTQELYGRDRPCAKLPPLYGSENTQRPRQPMADGGIINLGVVAFEIAAIRAQLQPLGSEEAKRWLRQT